MEKKKLLLVFIHGFQGDDTTFRNFPVQLSALLSAALPHLSISSLVYPAFETRGDLNATVRRFTDWLTTTVIDLEVTRGTKSPMVEEGVRVIIAGHSMGGLVGAECLLGLVGEMNSSLSLGTEVSTTGDSKEQPQSTTAGETEVRQGKSDAAQRRREREETPASDEAVRLPMEPHMFPYIQGLLAFDTPYLGISPGVVAHGAEAHFNTGKAWYEGAVGVWGTVQGMTGVGGDGGVKGGQQEGKVNTAKAGANAPIPPQPPAQQGEPSSPSSSSSTNKRPISPSNTWSKYAIYGLGASALGLAAGTTAYFARSHLSSGYEWATSHLEFVGCLGRPEDLRKRFAAVVALGNSYDVPDPDENGQVKIKEDPWTELRQRGHLPNVGFANFYTLLGAGARATSTDQQQRQQQQLGTAPKRNEWSESVLGPERTFCNVPKQGRVATTKKHNDAKSGGIFGSWTSNGKEETKEDTEAGVWREALNDLATDEVAAHCDIFDPEKNLGYFRMGEEARDVVVGWVKRGGWGE